MKREEWLASLDAQNKVEETTPEARALKEKFVADLKKHGKIDTAFGVFGEGYGCDGYVEEVIRPETGGTFMKIYGCSFLFKGYAHKSQVDGMQMAKALFSTIAREFTRLFYISLAFKFVFRRKKLLKFIAVVMDEVNHKALRHYDIPWKEHNVMEKEITRAVNAALKEEKGDYVPIFEKFTRFLCLFLYLDNAYRFRVQDAFGYIGRNHIAGLFEGIETMIERETEKGIAPKWTFIKIGLEIAFLLDPTLKRIVGNVIQNLDLKYIAMDEADWYFCLKWHSYNFGGLTEEERFAEREKIDREKGHLFLV